MPAHPPTPAPALLDEGSSSWRLPLVLVHGLTGSKEDFAPILPTLARQRRVLAPDLPGHGATPSAGSPDDHALGPLGGWLLDVIDHCGVGDFHLLGHSLGGLLAQQVAQRAAHRVCSLVLVGSGLGAPGERTADKVATMARAALDGGLPAAWAVITQGGDADGDPRSDFLRDRFLAMDLDALLGGARALLSAAPRWAFLRGLDVPALVCHGDGDDVWLPHEQRLLARTIRGARYGVIGDALHSPATENPAGLLALLTPFLARADPVGQRGLSPTTPSM